MSKKAWRNQQQEYLRQILELLKSYKDVANIGQLEYKEDFFRIFVDAFESRFCNPTYRIDVERDRIVPCKSQRPVVNGDAIWSYAKEQGWVHANMRSGESRYDKITMVQTWWDEWNFAICHYEKYACKRRRDR